MSRFHRSLPWLLTACAAALLAAGCSPDNNSNPDAKKVISSCLAVSADDASKILGLTVTANRMSGDDAPRSICAYKNAAGDTVALLNLGSADKSVDMAKVLAADQKTAKDLFSGNIKPPAFRQADGFMPGAFYGDITPRFDSLETQLETFEGGFKMIITINAPKDFPSGESQSAAIAHKVFENIQNGTAFATLQ
jgi:hypothetical protein